MLGKLLIAALFAVLAYKAFGWYRNWQAGQSLATPPKPDPLGPGEDLRRCAACDRYVAAAAIAACDRVGCPMKG